MIYIITLPLILLILLISFLLFLKISGLFITKKFNSSITNSFFHKPEILWNTLNDIPNYPLWRSDITEIKITTSQTWKEFFDQNNSLSYELLSQEKNQEIIVKLNDKNFPVSYTRKYILWEQDYMSFLKIEDEMIIRNASLRFLSFLFHDQRASIRTLMKSLDDHLDHKLK